MSSIWKTNTNLWCTNRIPKLDPGSLEVNVAFEGSQEGTKEYSLCSGEIKFIYHDHQEDMKG